MLLLHQKNYEQLCIKLAENKKLTLMNLIMSIMETPFLKYDTKVLINSVENKNLNNYYVKTNLKGKLIGIGTQLFVNIFNPSSYKRKVKIKYPPQFVFQKILDEKGYLVLEGILSRNEVSAIKNRVSEIQKKEAPRNGEVGYSSKREKFLTKNQSLRLNLFDKSFLALKYLLNFTFRLVPPLKESFGNTRDKPFDLNNSNSIKREFRQMLVAIVDQFENPGIDRVCDLVNKGPEFDILYQHPEVLHWVEKIIGSEYKLSSLNTRSPEKNNIKQQLHVDYPWQVKGGDYFACNALFLLDDMDESNGATRVIPGTHKTGQLPQEHLQDLKAAHPNEIIINAKAGDVLFLNSHVWHGGTINHSGKSRVLIQCYFVHKAHPPQQHQRFQIRTETKKRLSNSALEILDIYEEN